MHAAIQFISGVRRMIFCQSSGTCSGTWQMRDTQHRKAMHSRKLVLGNRRALSSCSYRHVACVLTSSAIAHRPGAIAMSDMFRELALLLLFAGFCRGQSLKRDEALDRYLAGTRDRQPECSDWVFAIQIDASLPKLNKHGSMSGLKVVPRTGKAMYRGLRFTGDNLVKTAVIARFLTNDTKPYAGADVTRQNYSFVYDRTSGYNGLIAYVFRLKPVRKRVGLFKGELWLQATTAA